MRTVVAVAVVCLGACNAVFGVDKTGLAPSVDATINCSTLPGDPAFHDEDDDDYADLCDNCPGIPNQDQAETDGDGIGDACDPQLGKVDTRVAFFSFADPTMMLEWTTIAGRWTINEDAFIADDDTNPNEQDVVYRSQQWGPPLALEARVTVDSIAAAPTVTYKLGIEAVLEATGDNGAECFVSRRWNGSAHEDLVRTWVRGEEASTALVSSQLTNGASYRLRLTIRDTSSACQVDGERGDGGTASQMLTGFTPRIDHVGAFTQAVAGRIHYLIVYQLGA